MSRKSEARRQKTFLATVLATQGRRLPREVLPPPSWEVFKSTLEKPTHQGRLGQSQPCPGQEVTAGPSGLVHMAFGLAVHKGAGHFPTPRRVAAGGRAGPDHAETEQSRRRGGEGAWAPCQPGAHGQPRSCGAKNDLTSTSHGVSRSAQAQEEPAAISLTDSKPQACFVLTRVHCLATNALCRRCEMPLISGRAVCVTVPVLPRPLAPQELSHPKMDGAACHPHQTVTAPAATGGQRAAENCRKPQGDEAQWWRRAWLGTSQHGSTSAVCREPRVPPLGAASDPSSQRWHQAGQGASSASLGPMVGTNTAPTAQGPPWDLSFPPSCRPRPQGPSAANTQHWCSSPAERGTWSSGSNCQYLLGEEVPGADNELEDVLQGLEGAHERLAGLSPAGVVHVLCQHRDQLPAGCGRVWPGLGRLPGSGQTAIGAAAEPCHAACQAFPALQPRPSPRLPSQPHPSLCCSRRWVRTCRRAWH